MILISVDFARAVLAEQGAYLAGATRTVTSWSTRVAPNDLSMPDASSAAASTSATLPVSMPRT